jgi:SepF-like predicted cell division protein (DUF552 family)
MPFNLFQKKKQEDRKETSVAPREDANLSQPNVSEVTEESSPKVDNETQESSSEPIQMGVESEMEPEKKITEQTTESSNEQENQNETKTSKTYLKAMPLKELTDVEKVKLEIQDGNIVILKITPLASKSVEEVKTAVNELYQFAESIGGDIARLGEERVVICPKTVRIWREKTPKTVANQTSPTAA